MDFHLLPDLMVFLEVVRAGTLTGAAKRLNTVQSNVTARIKILEYSVGVPLLERHARGVKATTAGEAALTMALRMDAVMDDLRFTFGGVRGARTVKLRLGAIETVAARHLPEMVGKFVARRQWVDLSVQTGSSAALLAQLKEGGLDVVFISRRPGIAGLREQSAFRDDLVLLAPRDRTSFSRAIAPSGAPVKVLVQRMGCSYTERLLELLRGLGHGYQMLELGTLEGIVGFVEAGVGIAVMPRSFVTSVRGARSVKLFPLPVELRRFETFLVAAPKADASQVVNDFVDFVGARKVRDRQAAAQVR